MSVVQGRWQVTIETPMGARSGVLELRAEGATLSGTLSDAEHRVEIEDGRIEGNRLTWSARIEKPMRLKFKFTALVDQDRISGSARHMLGSATFSGARIHSTGA